MTAVDVAWPPLDDPELCGLQKTCGGRELMLRVGARFVRVEPRRRAAAFVRGLLAGLPRVNCWSIAGWAGDAGPQGMQLLLSAAAWDEAGVRDDLRGYVLEHFAAQACQYRRRSLISHDQKVPLEY